MCGRSIKSFFAWWMWVCHSTIFLIIVDKPIFTTDKDHASLILSLSPTSTCVNEASSLPSVSYLW